MSKINPVGGMMGGIYGAMNIAGAGLGVMNVLAVSKTIASLYIEIQRFQKEVRNLQTTLKVGIGFATDDFKRNLQSLTREAKNLRDALQLKPFDRNVIRQYEHDFARLAEMGKKAALEMQHNFEMAVTTDTLGRKQADIAANTTWAYWKNAGMRLIGGEVVRGGNQDVKTKFSILGGGWFGARTIEDAYGNKREAWSTPEEMAIRKQFEMERDKSRELAHKERMDLLNNMAARKEIELQEKNVVDTESLANKNFNFFQGLQMESAIKLAGLNNKIAAAQYYGQFGTPIQNTPFLGQMAKLSMESQIKRNQQIIRNIENLPITDQKFSEAIAQDMEDNPTEWNPQLMSIMGEDDAAAKAYMDLYPHKFLLNFPGDMEGVKEMKGNILKELIANPKQLKEFTEKTGYFYREGRWGRQESRKEVLGRRTQPIKTGLANTVERLNASTVANREALLSVLEYEDRLQQNFDSTQAEIQVKAIEAQTEMMSHSQAQAARRSELPNLITSGAFTSPGTSQGVSRASSIANMTGHFYQEASEKAKEKLNTDIMRAMAETNPPPQRRKLIEKYIKEQNYKAILELPLDASPDSQKLRETIATAYQNYQNTIGQAQANWTNPSNQFLSATASQAQLNQNLLTHTQARAEYNINAAKTANALYQNSFGTNFLQWQAKSIWGLSNLGVTGAQARYDLGLKDLNAYALRERQIASAETLEDTLKSGLNSGIASLLYQAYDTKDDNERKELIGKAKELSKTLDAAEVGIAQKAIQRTETTELNIAKYESDNVAPLGKALQEAQDRLKKFSTEVQVASLAASALGQAFSVYSQAESAKTTANAAYKATSITSKADLNNAIANAESQSRIATSWAETNLEVANILATSNFDAPSRRLQLTLANNQYDLDTQLASLEETKSKTSAQNAYSLAMAQAEEQRKAALAAAAKQKKSGFLGAISSFAGSVANVFAPGAGTLASGALNEIIGGVTQQQIAQIQASASTASATLYAYFSADLTQKWNSITEYEEALKQEKAIADAKAQALYNKIASTLWDQEDYASQYSRINSAVARASQPTIQLEIVDKLDYIGTAFDKIRAVWETYFDESLSLTASGNSLLEVIKESAVIGEWASNINEYTKGMVSEKEN